MDFELENHWQMAVLSPVPDGSAVERAPRRPCSNYVDWFYECPSSKRSLCLI